MKKKIGFRYAYKDQSGSAIIYAIFAFLLVSLIATLVISVFTNNLLQSKQQEHSIEAYYLAYSGVQMAFTALNAEDQTRLDKVVDDGAILIDDDISFGNGTIAVTVKNSTNTDYTGWVMITATGTLAEYNVSRTRTMYFDPENQNDMVWKEN